MSGKDGGEDDKRDLFSYWQETSKRNVFKPATDDDDDDDDAAEDDGAGASFGHCNVGEGPSHHGEKWSPSTDILRGGVAKFMQMFGDPGDASSPRGVPMSAPKGRRDKTWSPSESQSAPKQTMWSPQDDIDTDRIDSIKAMWGAKAGARNPIAPAAPDVPAVPLLQTLEGEVDAGDSPASPAPMETAMPSFSSAIYGMRDQASPPWRKQYQKYFGELLPLIVIMFALIVIIREEESIRKMLRYEANDGNENNEPGGTSTSSSVWRQLGQSIDGEAKGDSFGKSVALFADGMTVVVGAPYSSEDENGAERGQAKIYHMEDERWIQLGNTMYGEGQWGWSVALSSGEGAFAIGAPSFWDDDRPGYVTVYGLDGSVRSIYSEASSDGAGWSVSLSRDAKLLAVGAPWDSDGGEQCGQVRVYEWVDGVYEQLAKSIHGEAPQDKLGYSVSLSEDGKVLAVFATQSRREPGYVKVYHWDDTTRDYQQLGDAIVGENAFDSSGYSVALSTDGTTLVVGTNGLDENGDSYGHVSVYRIDEGADGTDLSWKQLGQDIQGETDDNSGMFVDLSADGGTLAVGIPYDGENGDVSGHVRVYRAEDDGDGPRWEQLGQSIGGEAEDVWSGTSVSLAADGRTLAIGADGKEGNGNNAGQVRVYHLEEAYPR